MEATRSRRQIGVFLWLLTFAYMGLIYYLSSADSVASHIYLAEGVDKVLHMIEFGVLGSLFYLSMRNSFPAIANQYCMGIAIGCAILYALLDEWHQSLDPERTASIFDVLADVVGVVAAVLFASRMFRKKFESLD